MHWFCMEPDWRLSGKMVMASRARHSAGGEKQSNSVYGELCSAVTPTKPATAARHSTRGLGGNRAPNTPRRFPQLGCWHCQRPRGKVCRISALAEDQGQQHGDGQPLPRETYSFLLHGDAAVTEETGNTPESFNGRAAAVVRAKGSLQPCHRVLLLAFFFFFLKEPLGP